MTAIALSAELEVAELDGVVNTVTVERGGSANFTISLTASGSVACPSTHGAKVHTSYSVDSAGAISSNTMSAEKAFSTPAGCTSGNDTITWSGAPTAQTVAASVSASATAPLGPRTIVLRESNGNTETTSSNGSGGKLDDNTGTTLTITVVAAAAPANAGPSVPGAPVLDAFSSTPNQGVFGLTWTASTDDGLPTGSSIAYQLQHKDADDAGYSDVSGATALSTNSFSFTSGSPEAEGTWTYKVRASDGTLQSTYSAASSEIKVDRSAPNAPTASFSKTAEDTVGGWYKDSVTVSYASNGDPALADTSAGSGVASVSSSQLFSTSSDSHGYSGTATDNAGNQSSATTGTVKVDATAPTVDCPTTVPTFALGSAGGVVTGSASDDHSGLATSATPSANATDTSSIGVKSVQLSATDNVGHMTTVSCNYRVIFDFGGFFQPVDNLTTLNKAKAGSGIPLKWSLDGNQGLSILAAGYPKSQAITCPGGSTPTDNIEVTDTSGQSGLKYDALADQYNYVWKTEKGWGGTCRQVVVKLTDDTEHRANFTFTK